MLYTLPSEDDPVFDAACIELPVRYLPPLNMLQVDILLYRVQQQAKKLGIPINEKIDPHVTWNNRAAKRLGCCSTVHDKDYRYRIEISSALPQAGAQQCMNTLAHEILHTCEGCMNHGKLWKSYAARMSSAYGYRIQRVTSTTANGIEMPARNVHYHWQITCRNCGNRFYRQRSCTLTQKPQNYRCAKCHIGTLKVENLDI